MDAQRRLTDAEAKYYRSLIEYTLAVKNVHFQKGSLLVYNQVYLSEGPWPGAAYSDAMERDSNRYDPIPIINYIFSRPWPVSRGEFPQRVVPLDAADQIEELPRPEGTNPESAATSPESHPAQEVRANERVRMANRGGPAIRPRVRRVPGTSLARRSHYATRGAPARFNATPQSPGIVIDRSETNAAHLEPVTGWRQLDRHGLAGQNEEGTSESLAHVSKAIFRMSQLRESVVITVSDESQIGDEPLSRRR